ncbi:hypothetical protein JHK84_031866 [Glycine max]|nr:hypothetical protein JHK84_031866 [Glycine max]
MLKLKKLQNVVQEEANGSLWELEMLELMKSYAKYMVFLKEQFIVLIVYMHGITFELDEEMAADDEDREWLQMMKTENCYRKS